MLVFVWSGIACSLSCLVLIIEATTRFSTSRMLSNILPQDQPHIYIYERFKMISLDLDVTYQLMIT